MFLAVWLLYVLTSLKSVHFIAFSTPPLLWFSSSYVSFLGAVVCGHFAVSDDFMCFLSSLSSLFRPIDVCICGCS
ncbi:hypothetical protein QBC46DRAFT_375139, partial [Diplogelasinospora grovesii]